MNKKEKVNLASRRTPKDILQDKPSWCFIGNYLPRQCGIATFTTDLCTAVTARVKSRCNTSVIAINDIPNGYLYPGKVQFEIRRDIRNDYCKLFRTWSAI